MGEACPSMREEAFGSTLRYRELMRMLFEPHWPSPGLREWVYTVTRRVPEADGSPRDKGGVVGGSRLMCGSRMYLQQGEGEMRLALALAAILD